MAEDASHEDIQRAYRRLARRHHPDANPGDASAEERFKEISAAYDVLSDPVKRREYDQVRRSSFAPGGFDAGSGTFRVTVDDLGDLGGIGDLDGLDDLLGDLLGGRRPRSGRQGRHLEAQLHLSFEDAVLGVTTEVRARSAAGSTRPVRVRVPAGVEDGQRIRVAWANPTPTAAHPVTSTSPSGSPPTPCSDARAEAMDGSPRTRPEV